MATGESLVTALLLVGSGILTIVTGVLSRRGKLPRNWFLGLRTRPRLRSDEAGSRLSHLSDVVFRALLADVANKQVSGEDSQVA